MFSNIAQPKKSIRIKISFYERQYLLN